MNVFMQKISIIMEINKENTSIAARQKTVVENNIDNMDVQEWRELLQNR